MSLGEERGRIQHKQGQPIPVLPKLLFCTEPSVAYSKDCVSMPWDSDSVLLQRQLHNLPTAQRGILL